MQTGHLPLRRTTSYQTSTSKITPSNSLTRSTSLSPDPDTKFLVPKPTYTTTCYRIRPGLSTFLRSLFGLFSLPSFRSSLGRKVTGTLFGHRRGHACFAIQENPGSDPVLIVKLGLSIETLVRDMSSGLVRIALECHKPSIQPRSGPEAAREGPVGLFDETVWEMYCNGRRCGKAMTRLCEGIDRHVLGTLRSVSVGAGVIPVVEGGYKKSAMEGELLYMRARFERVVGGKDSEAFYMLNPDGNGGPELSIFMMRI